MLLHENEFLPETTIREQTRIALNVMQLEHLPPNRPNFPLIGVLSAVAMLTVFVLMAVVLRVDRGL